LSDGGRRGLALPVRHRPENRLILHRRAAGGPVRL